jgi:hypothetical protein
MFRLQGGLLLVALLSMPASACINDKELPSHEREFRSQYTRQAYPTPKVKVSAIQSPLWLAGGAALLGGAFVAVFRVSSRSKG